MQRTPSGGVSRRGRPWMLVLFLLVLLGAVAAVTVLNQQGTTTYDAHDHDRDGTPDHGAGAH